MDRHGRPEEPEDLMVRFAREDAERQAAGGPLSPSDDAQAARNEQLAAQRELLRGEVAEQLALDAAAFAVYMHKHNAEPDVSVVVGQQPTAPKRFSRAPGPSVPVTSKVWVVTAASRHVSEHTKAPHGAYINSTNTTYTRGLAIDAQGTLLRFTGKPDERRGSSEVGTHGVEVGTSDSGWRAAEPARLTHPLTLTPGPVGEYILDDQLDPAFRLAQQPAFVAFRQRLSEIRATGRSI